MMPRARLTARAAALATVCAMGATAAVATASPTTGMRATATIQVGGAAAVPATSTTQGFLGFATSLSTIPALSGQTADPDTPFVNMLKALSPGAPVLLRLGGNSADTAWWPTPSVTKKTFLYTLTPRWGANVRALLTAVGGKAILGVNLEQGPKNEAKIAPAEVADFNRYIGAGRIDAFELGNEPEFFPLSVVKGVRGVRGPDTMGAYGKEFTHIASELGGAPLAGPGSVGTQWVAGLGTLLSDMPARLKLATVHAYALKNCSHFAQLSVADFFTPSAIQGLADSIHQTVKAAAAHGKPLRVDEINGITCGGKAGVSNSFGEALWALNVLPALWQAGVQGVNFQSVYGDLNQMIHADHSASGWSVSAEPEYYGLLAFADAAPAGSHLMRISEPSLPGFYQFAVRAPNGSERIVLTNVGSAPRTVGVSASGTRGPGSLSLLSAKSLSATSGTTLGGQHLSPRTGQLTGPLRAIRIRPNAERAYAVRVPAHAAAILTLPHGGALR
jgi:hypothetical protein